MYSHLYVETAAERGKCMRRQRMKEARKLGTHTKEEWEAMKEFFGCCVRCGRDDMHLERDHIIPIYQGGSDSIQNIQPVCAYCNCKKGPEDIDHRLRFAGVPDEWIPTVSV